ncbi:hypothetical protein HPB48_000520 [Haemaphysalis longicornis]|uniref:BTB domain-containing protein n=1 Tax=Haemaphysalis longicornis TaxID=44386 RepID=A0A9J6GI17_HAELO|nr:hypothetical protein HPB48_000520 [Haemaphysalis longicornis]
MYPNVSLTMYCRTKSAITTATCLKFMQMSEHTLGFFETGEGSDVTFIVTSDNFDDRRAIRAHRQYLALTNEGFQAMLLGDSAQLREVIVRDIHPDGFYNLIR